MKEDRILWGVSIIFIIMALVMAIYSVRSVNHLNERIDILSSNMRSNEIDQNRIFKRLSLLEMSQEDQAEFKKYQELKKKYDFYDSRIFYH